MRGCLLYCGLFVLAIILLICLIGIRLGSSSAFFWAIVTSLIIALILYLENQRKKAEKKRQEEARQKAVAEANQRAIVERQKAIVEARQRALTERQRALTEARKRPNLFTFNPSTDLEDLSVYAQKKNPVQWAAAIQRRYKATKSALDDSVMVVNDDVDQLRGYREKLHKGVMKDYETAIRPFKEKLALIEEKIPKPKELKIAENYTFPEPMQPKQIEKALQQSMSTAMSSMSDVGGQINRLISNSGGFSNIKTVNKGEAAVLVAIVGIKLAIAAINQKKTVEKKLTEVQKVQADVDKYCVQMAGAIKNMGVAASEIMYLQQLHDKAIDYMMQYYDAVKELSNQDKSLDDLDKSEIKAVESFYMGGKQLARLMQVDIMKSVGQ